MNPVEYGSDFGTDLARKESVMGRPQASEYELFDHVQITDRSHPWYGESGEVVVLPRPVRILGNQSDDLWMEVDLQNGAGRCGVRPEQAKKARR